MLQADSFERRQLPLEGDAMTVLCPYTYALRSLHLIKETGYRQTPLLHHTDLLTIKDFGIDEDHGGAAILRNVHHQKTLVHIDLRSGKTDTGRGIHRLEHVIDQS